MSTTLSTLSDSSSPTAAFTPSKTSFRIDCDAGDIVVEVRRGSGDSVWKMLTEQGANTGLVISAGRARIIDNPVDATQYRIRTATPNVSATAVATESV